MSECSSQAWTEQSESMDLSRAGLFSESVDKVRRHSCDSRYSSPGPDSPPSPATSLSKSEVGVFQPFILGQPYISSFSPHFETLQERAGSLENSRTTRRRTNTLGDVLAMLDLNAVQNNLNAWRERTPRQLKR